MMFERHEVPFVMPAMERMALTDDIIGGKVDSFEEIALRLAPFLRLP